MHPLQYVLAAFLVLASCAGGVIPTEEELAETFEIIAHRGVHTNWEKEGYDRIDGCEACRIYKPTVPYIENTLASIQAAFDYGATIVEIDIRRSADGDLMIFHDSLLECRTDGTGRVEDRTCEYLKSLDIGYGYTADNGETYPFRGKGTGLMPTLKEVLAAFPDGKFLIDQKDGSLETAAVLVTIVAALPEKQQKRLYYWGSDKTYEFVRNNSSLRRLFFTYPQAKEWFVSDSLLLGLRSPPDEWQGQIIVLPAKYRFIIRGWPWSALRRNHKAGIRLFLQINSEKDAVRLSRSPADGIVTDYIETVGPYFRGPLDG